jgi:hypothetical protein
VKVLRPELAAPLGSDRFLREIEIAELVDPASADTSSRPTAEVLYYAMSLVARPTSSQSNPRLLTVLRLQLRLGHYSLRTERPM